MKNFTKRIATLEHHLGDISRPDGQEACARRFTQAAKVLLGCIAADQRDRVYRAILDKNNPGLRMLWLQIACGQWSNPVPIPAAVVDAFFSWPCLEPWLKCSGCRLHLPYATGFWMREGVRNFWQGPLVPFRACPACNGVAHDFADKPPDLPDYLPALPGALWRFQTATPHSRK